MPLSAVRFVPDGDGNGADRVILWWWSGGMSGRDLVFIEGGSDSVCDDGNFEDLT